MKPEWGEGPVPPGSGGRDAHGVPLPQGHQPPMLGCRLLLLPGDLATGSLSIRGPLKPEDSGVGEGGKTMPLKAGRASSGRRGRAVWGLLATGSGQLAAGQDSKGRLAAVGPVLAGTEGLWGRGD